MQLSFAVFRTCRLLDVLDEMDPNRSWKIFTDHQWLMHAIFRTRCASILRCVLVDVRYPRCSSTMPSLTLSGGDQRVLLGDWSSFTCGSRCKMQRQCASRTRRNFDTLPGTKVLDGSTLKAQVKSPLSKNVEKLPLPEKAKRRFLYQWS